MIFPKKYFDNIAKSINPENFNILLIGVYPNMGDNLFHNNRELIDTKKFLFDNERNDYAFLSHHWLTPNYRGDKSRLQKYRDIYINMNNDTSIHNIIQSDLCNMFDVIFVDSFVLCHVKNIVNFYTLAVNLIKNNGIVLLKKRDIEIAGSLFDGDITYYNLDNEEDDSPFTIIHYYYNDLISMKITIEK